MTLVTEIKNVGFTLCRHPGEGRDSGASPRRYSSRIGPWAPTVVSQTRLRHDVGVTTLFDFMREDVRHVAVEWCSFNMMPWPSSITSVKMPPMTALVLITGRIPFRVVGRQCPNPVCRI